MDVQPLPAEKQPAFLVGDAGGDEIRMFASGKRNPNEEELAFFSRVERLEHRIRRLVPAGDRRTSLVQRLRYAAKIGLETPNDVVLGSAAVRSIELDIVEIEGPLLRRGFLNATLLLGGSAFGLSVLSAALLDGLGQQLAWLGPTRDLLFDAAWVAAGASIGMMFFAFVNSLEITIDNIGRFDSTGLGPPLRLAFVAMVTLVLCSLLLSDALVLGIGDFVFNEFRDASPVAFLLGFFAGYSDVQATRLISNVLDRTSERVAAR